MLRRTLALGTLTLFTSLAASPVNAVDPATLLRLAFDSPQKISYEGEVQSTEIGDSQAMVSVYRVEHLAPDLTRRWYIAPQSIYGDSVISRGQRTYNVDVKNNRLVVDQNGAIDDQVAINDNFDLLSSNYRVETAPDDTIANRTTHVLLLVNKHTGATTMRVWIDAQTHLVLQKERYAANGSLTSQVRFEQLHYTSTIPAAVFALPTGFSRSTGIRHGAPTNDIPKLVDAAGFSAKHPRYLPDGFLAVTGDVSDVNNVRTLHLLYSDGIRTVSLFQNARGASVDMSHYTVHDIAIQNHTGRYVEQGPITLLAWSESGLHFTLVGELSRDELVKIAASVVP
jgi:negative regulator of sigma E activity